MAPLNMFDQPVRDFLTFARVEAGLADFIDGCETALTIFAPTDEAIARLGDGMPSDTQLLRELLCDGAHCSRSSLPPYFRFSLRRAAVL